MELGISITFNGQAEEAFTFYKRVFGDAATIPEITYYRDVPGEEVPEGFADKVCFAEMRIGNIKVAAYDQPGLLAEKGPFEFVLSLSTVTDGTAVFNSLAEGGTIIKPFTETPLRQLWPC